MDEPILRHRARDEPDGCLRVLAALQRLGKPDREISRHAEAILGELERFSLERCAGVAFSPEHAAVLEHFGLRPTRIAPPGEYAC
jgi:hypothetical protein